VLIILHVFNDTPEEPQVVANDPPKAAVVTPNANRESDTPTAQEPSASVPENVPIKLVAPLEARRPVISGSGDSQGQPVMVDRDTGSSMALPPQMPDDERLDESLASGEEPSIREDHAPEIATP